MANCCKGDIYIPSSFKECNTIQMQILYLAKKVEELEERVKALEDKNEQNE